MRDVLDALTAWSGTDGVGLATVIDTSQSAPRQPGASLAVHPDGRVIGSVSGGCVEGAVVEIAQGVMAGDPPSRTRFGISDEQAMGVGLTCGGEIEVFVDVLSAPDLDRVLRVHELVHADEPVAVATVVDGPATHGARVVVTTDDADGTLGNEGLDVAVVDDARGMLAQATTGLRHYGPTGQRRLDDVTVFIDVHAPRPRMYVFGAIDFAAAVARIGRFLDFHVTVCDARRMFATRERFPFADEVVAEWPHRFLARAPVDRRTIICVLTHDPKFDVPVLEVALRTDAAYVGAMGSRRTHEDRLARLREVGMTDEELARLRSPIGLDLGARTPEETAVSIAAEIIALRWGGDGRPLAAADGPIHREGSAPQSAASR